MKIKHAMKGVELHSHPPAANSPPAPSRISGSTGKSLTHIERVEPTALIFSVFHTPQHSDDTPATWLSFYAEHARRPAWTRENAGTVELLHKQPARPPPAGVVPNPGHVDSLEAVSRGDPCATDNRVSESDH